MSAFKPKLVLDTNVLLRGLANMDSTAGRILLVCDNRNVVLLLNKEVLAEYRIVLGNPLVTQRHSAITPEAVELVLRRLRYICDYQSDPQIHFRFDRDPRDEKFIELAIAGEASHIISGDSDLISLTKSHTDAAKRFRQRLPNTKILHPGAFLWEQESLLK
ncbi:MAG TPA: putative toxin-antitoxin system toxin component, PIN family [Phycisphaerae bacterium]|nr:putative toxin-antitoxin system toxin component, PIN family [Phycisphaerae bacterium]